MNTINSEELLLQTNTSRFMAFGSHKSGHQASDVTLEESFYALEPDVDQMNGHLTDE